MARFIPKQFAENSTTSVVFGSFQEQGGNVGDGTISSDPATLQGGTAWPLGWSAATDNFFKIPRGEEMEGLERVLSAAIIQQFKDGLTFWQSEMPVTQYQTIVQYQTGSDNPKLYLNITGVSTSTPPDSDATNWFMFLDTGTSHANVDLSNLSATGEAHFANPALSNSSYTTNRILEITQDIKVEINSSNKLVLKAGSKVYFPNGFEADGTTPKFDVVTIESDVVSANSHNGYHENFLLSPNSTYVYTLPDENNFSGPTQPIGSTYAIWYDTANNVIKTTGDGGSTWNGGFSFPVCRALGGASNTVTSIDQIFNGFGYIGTQIFTLPGIKVECPNGKNADGTLISVILTSSSVSSYDGTYGASTFSGSVVGGGFWGRSYPYCYVETKEQIPTNSNGYVLSENKIYQNVSGTLYQGNLQHLCDYKIKNGVVTYWKPLSVDSVANSNMSNISSAGRSYLSGIGMPSTKYDNVTVLASGQSYKAPANGYFVFNTVVGGASYVLMSNSTAKIYTADVAGIAGTGKTTMGCFVPCHAGDSMSLTYSISVGSSTTLYFVYAKGEN